jgi:hypothetical protein
MIHHLHTIDTPILVPLNKEDIWEPIHIELEKKSLEQRRNGYPFVENWRKKFHDKLD